MKTYIVFRKGAQLIVLAPNIVRAIQSAIVDSGGFASEWVCHRLDTYPEHLQTRLLSETRQIHSQQG